VSDFGLLDPEGAEGAGDEWEEIDVSDTEADRIARRRDREFEDFTVRLKFKSVEGNSGFYFRVEEVKSGVGAHGFQAEIAPHGPIGGLYETGGRAWVVKPEPEKVKECFKPGEWNQMTVTARGRDVTVEVNGVKTAELTDDPGRTKGHIALQLHGGQDMHVEFKDIKIREY